MLHPRGVRAGRAAHRPAAAHTLRRRRTAIGDHICYYSDLRKMRAHYPGWDITVSLEQTIAQIVEAWQHKLVS